MLSMRNAVARPTVPSKDEAVSRSASPRCRRAGHVTVSRTPPSDRARAGHTRTVTNHVSGLDTRPRTNRVCAIQKQRSTAISPRAGRRHSPLARINETAPFTQTENSRPLRISRSRLLLCNRIQHHGAAPCFRSAASICPGAGRSPLGAEKRARHPASAFAIWPTTERTIPMALTRQSSDSGGRRQTPGFACAQEPSCPRCSSGRLAGRESLLVVHGAGSNPAPIVRCRDAWTVSRTVSRNKQI
jgi:hypothetical protein